VLCKNTFIKATHCSEIDAKPSFQARRPVVATTCRCRVRSARFAAYKLLNGTATTKTLAVPCMATRCRCSVRPVEYQHLSSPSKCELGAAEVHQKLAAETRCGPIARCACFSSWTEGLPESADPRLRSCHRPSGERPRFPHHIFRAHRLPQTIRIFETERQCRCANAMTGWVPP
jgi:hypothetical protein